MTEHNETIIVVEELVAGYGDRIVLDHLSFTVRRGEIVFTPARNESQLPRQFRLSEHKFSYRQQAIETVSKRTRSDSRASLSRVSDTLLNRILANSLPFTKWHW